MCAVCELSITFEKLSLEPVLEGGIWTPEEGADPEEGEGAPGGLVGLCCVGEEMCSVCELGLPFGKLSQEPVPEEGRRTPERGMDPEGGVGAPGGLVGSCCVGEEMCAVCRLSIAFGELSLEPVPEEKRRTSEGGVDPEGGVGAQGGLVGKRIQELTVEVMTQEGEEEGLGDRAVM